MTFLPGFIWQFWPISFWQFWPISIWQFLTIWILEFWPTLIWHYDLTIWPMIIWQFWPTIYWQFEERPALSTYFKQTFKFFGSFGNRPKIRGAKNSCDVGDGVGRLCTVEDETGRFSRFFKAFEWIRSRRRGIQTKHDEAAKNVNFKCRTTNLRRSRRWFFAEVALSSRVPHTHYVVVLLLYQDYDLKPPSGFCKRLFVLHHP